MDLITVKETEQFTLIVFKSSSGERIELEAFKNNDIIRINSGMEDRDLVVKPRTSNELDIKLV